MEATTFAKRLKTIVKNANKTLKAKTGNEEVEGGEAIRTICGHKFTDIFMYASACEAIQEANMFHKRITTFMMDFSIAEWFKKKDVEDTFYRAANEWKDNEKYMAELLLVLNFKCCEHANRNNWSWKLFYEELFYGLKNLVYAYYKGDDKKVAYVWRYLD